MVRRSGVLGADVRHSVTSLSLLMGSGLSGELGASVVAVVALESLSLNDTASIHSKLAPVTICYQCLSL